MERLPHPLRQRLALLRHQQPPRCTLCCPPQRTGARYTRMHKPQQMRLTDSGLTKSAAQKREAQIKRLGKAEKTALWQHAAPLPDTETTP